MNTTDQLIAGYTAYTDAADFGATVGNQAPATSPATSVILSIIAESTVGCGAAVSALSAAGVGFTIHAGC